MVRAGGSGGTGEGGYAPELARLTAAPGPAPAEVAYGPGPEQFAELWLPQAPGPRPVVVLVHGGYWRRRYGLDVMHALAGDLRDRGLAVWNLEYRRVGSDGGGWPGTFEDVAAGVDALLDVPGGGRLDLGRVAVAGHSAGGHLALWAAGRRRLAGGPGSWPRLTPAVVVALAGVCDLFEAARRHLSDDAVVDLLGGTPAGRPERYAHASPGALLPLGVRQVLAHGTADDSVPFDLSEGHRAAAAAAGDECELLRLEGVDHFALIDPASDAWRTVAGRLQALLGAAGP